MQTMLPPAGGPDDYEEQGEGGDQIQTQAIEPIKGRKAPKPIDAAEVMRRWVEADRYLIRDRNNFWLNQSFAEGEQWVRYTGRTLQELTWDQTGFDWQTRVTIDKYGPRFRGLVARLIPEPLVFDSSRDGLDPVEGRNAALREQLLEAEHDSQAWEDVRLDCLMDTLYGGTAAISVEWNPYGGNDQDEITDPYTALTYPGGVECLTALSICDFTVQPSVRDWRQAGWWMRGTSSPPELVQERYQLKEKPRPDAKMQIGARHRSLLSDNYSGQSTELLNTGVYVLYVKPCGGTDGQEVHVVNGVVVERHLWRFPFDRLNLRVFRCRRQRGKWTGSTFLTTARPIQQSINHVSSTIMEHCRRAANAQLLVPEGSVQEDDVFTDQVGGIVRYVPDPTGQRPGWMEAPALARWLPATVESLAADLDDQFHTHAISRGEQIGDRNSGLALSILAEKDDGPLGPIAKDFAEGWGETGEMVLLLMRQQKPDGGTITLTRNGMPINVPWTPENIGEAPRITVPLKSTMPRTRAALQAMVKDMVQAMPKLADEMDSAAVAEMLGFPDAAQFFSSLDVHTSLARYENSMMAQSVPMVPDTFNDHSAHIVEHRRQQNTPEYGHWEPDAQGIMEDHIAAHEQMEQEKAMEEAQKQAQGMAGQLPPGGPAGALPPGPEGGPPPEGAPPGGPPPGMMMQPPPGPPAEPGATA